MTETRIRFYGRLAEELQPELSLPFPAQGLTVAELREVLAERFGAPRLLDGRVKAAVRDEIAGEQRLVAPGEQVDFLAPLSGG